MITRAQAEALLTLAESLEACERLGVALEVLPHGEAIVRHPAGGFTVSCGSRFEAINPSFLRMMIGEEMSETGRDEYRYTVGQKGVSDQCRLVKPKQD